MSAPAGAPARRRTPLVVLGGFLGAGKTTLLRRMLCENAARETPRRIAVLVNDFGAVNLDAALIERASADTIALTNGCVCCQIGDDLSMALVRVLEATPPFDAIVVEASGISDPWKIAQIARADPTLEPEAIVVLVDASAVVGQAADPLLRDSLERQLARADVVALNKVDLVDAPMLDAARAWVRAQAGEVAVFETVEAALPVPLFGADWGVGRGDAGDSDAAAERDDAAVGRWRARPLGSDAERFESHLFRTDAVFALACLRELMTSMPAGVLRLKGVVRSDEHDWFELQFAGRHGVVRPALLPRGDAYGALVVIGLRGRLPVDALNERLARCRRIS